MMLCLNLVIFGAVQKKLLCYKLSKVYTWCLAPVDTFIYSWLNNPLGKIALSNKKSINAGLTVKFCLQWSKS